METGGNSKPGPAKVKNTPIITITYLLTITIVYFVQKPKYKNVDLELCRLLLDYIL